MLKTEPLIELPVFTQHCDLPRTMNETRRALRSGIIRSVQSFALGPDGTNIMLAASRWHDAMGVSKKADLIPCETPEQAVLRARATMASGVLAIYWTCAVFVRENKVFFDNPDTLPFVFQQTMQLDEMQLASRPEVASDFKSSHADWRILSHPSPAPLVSGLACSVINANSNADAARRCAGGEGEACITTETARKIHGLVKLHSFGSPEMVFFGGISQGGSALLGRAFHESISFEGKTVRHGPSASVAA
jgi:hypothetical protein